MKRGAFLSVHGRELDALPFLERGSDLVPSWKATAMFWKCWTYLNLGLDSEAIALCEATAAMGSSWTVYGCAAAANAGVGNMERARYWKDKLMQANPRFTLQRWRDVRYSPEPNAIAQFDRWLANLAKTGVPER